MSLESILQEQNDLLKQMLDALKGIPKMSDPGARPVVTRPANEKKAEPTTIDYEKQVKPAVLAFAAKKGREPLLALLKPFGITTAKDAKPEQYAELLKALSTEAA